MQKTDEAEYLGVLLNTKAAIEEEIGNRIRKAMVTWKRLKPYWRKETASRRQKLLIYSALIKTKVMYGLESAELKDS